MSAQVPGPREQTLRTAKLMDQKALLVASLAASMLWSLMGWASAVHYRAEANAAIFDKLEAERVIRRARFDFYDIQWRVQTLEARMDDDPATVSCGNVDGCALILDSEVVECWAVPPVTIGPQPLGR